MRAETASIESQPGMADASSEGGALPVWLLAVLAGVAAGPSLAWAVVGGFLSDDWSIWAGFESRGIVDGISYNALNAPARPGAAVLYSVIYGVVGPTPVLQGLILAALNAGLIVAAWYLGHRTLPTQVLLAFLVVLALAPNHATTRLWPATATHVLALALVFLGVGVLLRGRLVVAAALLCAATLVHEGTIALAVALVLLWCSRHPRSRWGRSLRLLAPAVASAALMALSSPKRGGAGPSPLNNIESFVPGQLGVGLWSFAVLARIGVLAVIGFLVAAVVRWLPSFRSDRPEYRLLLVGALLAASGAVPYAYLGTIFATSGFFDRSNLVPSAGVALVLASCWSLIAARTRTVGALFAIVAAGTFTWGQVEDVRAFTAAVEYGDEVLVALVALPLDPDKPVIVLDARDPGDTGVAMFVYDGDLGAALAHRTGEQWNVTLGENLACDDRHPREQVQVVDWRARDYDEVGDDAFRTSCERWRDR